MKREEIVSKIEAIQDKNYNEFNGSNEVELHIREDVADLIEEILQASDVSSKNEPCDLAGVSSSYLSECNRVEVIDKSGRAYTNYDCKIVKTQMQDDNKTLKVFIS